MKCTSVTIEVKRSNIPGAFDVVEVRRTWEPQSEEDEYVVSFEERNIASGIIYQAIPATLALLLGKRFFSGLDS